MGPPSKAAAWSSLKLTMATGLRSTSKCDWKRAARWARISCSPWDTTLGPAQNCSFCPAPALLLAQAASGPAGPPAWYATTYCDSVCWKRARKRFAFTPIVRCMSSWSSLWRPRQSPASRRSLRYARTFSRRSSEVGRLPSLPAFPLPLPHQAAPWARWGLPSSRGDASRDLEASREREEPLAPARPRRLPEREREREEDGEWRRRRRGVRLRCLRPPCPPERLLER
mmetsp:Transcript_63991/g.206139  ORF Transcript_63991/g.206139 Transcript_63991/m.206139 type:complete len:227 (+) Transcript_63991:1366-2046(+)